MNQSAAVIGLGYVGLPLCMKMVKAGFIDLAVNINNRMPFYVVDRVMDLLNDGGKSLRGSNILLLGISYKRDIGDVRESPALTILSSLQHKGAEVRYHDPHVPAIEMEGTYRSEPLTEELLRQQDCVVVTTDPSSIDYRFVA